MSEGYVLSIDEGTTGTTVLIFDHDGQVRARAYSEFTQHYPKPGWVEHDAEEIVLVTMKVIAEAIRTAEITPDASRPSASPTSARRSWFGSVPPVAPSAGPSSGRTGARRAIATSSSRMAWRT